MRNTPIGDNTPAAIPFVNKRKDVSIYGTTISYNKGGALFTTMLEDNTALLVNKKLLTNPLLVYRYGRRRVIDSENNAAINPDKMITVLAGTPLGDQPYTTYSSLHGCTVRETVNKVTVHPVHWKSPNDKSLTDYVPDRTVIAEQSVPKDDSTFPVITRSGIFFSGQATISLTSYGDIPTLPGQREVIPDDTVSTLAGLRGIVVRNSTGLQCLRGGTVLGQLLADGTIKQDYDLLTPTDVFIERWTPLTKIKTTNMMLSAIAYSVLAVEGEPPVEIPGDDATNVRQGLEWGRLVIYCTACTGIDVLNKDMSIAAIDVVRSGSWYSSGSAFFTSQFVNNVDVLLPQSAGTLSSDGEPLVGNITAIGATFGGSVLNVAGLKLEASSYQYASGGWASSAREILLTYQFGEITTKHKTTGIRWRPDGNLIEFAQSRNPTTGLTTAGGVSVLVLRLITGAGLVGVANMTVGKEGDIPFAFDGLGATPIDNNSIGVVAHTGPLEFTIGDGNNFTDIVDSGLPMLYDGLTMWTPLEYARRNVTGDKLAHAILSDDKNTVTTGWELPLNPPSDFAPSDPPLKEPVAAVVRHGNATVVFAAELAVPTGILPPPPPPPSTGNPHFSEYLSLPYPVMEWVRSTKLTQAVAESVLGIDFTEPNRADYQRPASVVGGVALEAYFDQETYIGDLAMYKERLSLVTDVNPVELTGGDYLYWSPGGILVTYTNGVPDNQPTSRSLLHKAYPARSPVLYTIEGNNYNRDPAQSFNPSGSHLRADSQPGIKSGDTVIAGAFFAGYIDGYVYHEYADNTRYGFAPTGTIEFGATMILDEEYMGVPNHIGDVFAPPVPTGKDPAVWEDEYRYLAFSRSIYHTRLGTSNISLSEGIRGLLVWDASEQKSDIPLITGDTLLTVRSTSVSYVIGPIGNPYSGLQKIRRYADMDIQVTTELRPEKVFKLKSCSPTIKISGTGAMRWRSI